MEIYSVKNNEQTIFYFIENENIKTKKSILIATDNTFKGFCFTPLKTKSINLDDVIVDDVIVDDVIVDDVIVDDVIVDDGRSFDPKYPASYVLRFKEYTSFFGSLFDEKNAFEILQTLHDDGKGILNTNKKHLILKVILGTLLNLGNVLWDLRKVERHNSFNIPIIINNENVVETVDRLLIKKFGENWKHGLNYPGIVTGNGGSRLSLYMALYYTSLGLNVYDFISKYLNQEIYYHKKLSLENFKKENEHILKYFIPETYGIKTITKVNTVYLSFDSSRIHYDTIELDDETMISIIKKVIVDYYEPIYKKSILKEIFKFIKYRENICSKKEFKEILKNIFLNLGYSENSIEVANKRKYTLDKLKTKEDIFKLMNKVVNICEEWWQECGLLPWEDINNDEFIKWLKDTRPKSYQNVILCAKNNDTRLETLDLDVIIAYATNGIAYLVLDKKNGLKNETKTKLISIASEYNFRNEDKRQMELVAEYALINPSVKDSLLEIFNETFD